MASPKVMTTDENKIDIIIEHLRQIHNHLEKHDSRFENIESVLSQHTETLAQHSETLAYHTKVLDHHSKILTQHTETLAQHSQYFKILDDRFINVEQILKNMQWLLEQDTKRLGRIEDDVRADRDKLQQVYESRDKVKLLSGGNGGL